MMRLTCRITIFVLFLNCLASAENRIQINQDQFQSWHINALARKLVQKKWIPASHSDWVKQREATTLQEKESLKRAYMAIGSKIRYEQNKPDSRLGEDEMTGMLQDQLNAVRDYQMLAFRNTRDSFYRLPEEVRLRFLNGEYNALLPKRFVSSKKVDWVEQKWRKRLQLSESQKLKWDELHRKYLEKRKVHDEQVMRPLETSKERKLLQAILEKNENLAEEAYASLWEAEMKMGLMKFSHQQSLMSLLDDKNKKIVAEEILETYLKQEKKIKNFRFEKKA